MSEHVLDTVRPAARAARPTWAGAAWRQYRLERRMFWRNPSAAFFGFVLPLLLLAMFGAIFAGDQEHLDLLVPGIAGMSVMASSFVALAYNLTFLRERGILKRLRGTPLPTSAYVTALAANAITSVVLQVALVLAVGRAFLDVPLPGDWVALAVFLAAGVACFAALGVALSHAIPNMESASTYVNAVFLPMIILAGVFHDEEDGPAVLRDVAEALPLKHLVDGLAAAVDGRLDGVALLVLAGWTAVGAVLAVRGFSWEARRS